MHIFIVLNTEYATEKSSEPSKDPTSSSSIPEFGHSNVRRRFSNYDLNQIDPEEEYFSEHSSEDEDYCPTDSEDNDGDNECFEPGLYEETEMAENEDEFIPQFDDFVKSTFDCTEDLPTPQRTRVDGNGIMLFIGQEFPTNQRLREHLRLYGIMNKFEMKFQKNCSDKVIVVCKAPNCNWRCYARRKNDGFTMAIRGLQEEHMCENNGLNKNSLASAKWVAAMIEDEMRMHHSSFTPRDIVKLVWHKYGCTITYWLAWKARGKALERIHGNYEESYAKVPELCRQIMASNPGSIVDWQCDPLTRKFKYLCVCLKSCLSGWRVGCRAVVGFDGCHLNGKYSGVLLCAIGMDGNNGMFPLGFFICSKENQENWDKFMSLIGPALKAHPLPLTIMSDRCKGLKQAITDHFPDCYQRFCFRHMVKNVSKYWRGEHITNLCWNAARTYSKAQFKRNLTELENAATGARAYLMREKSSMWARCAFGTNSMCDHLTNNWTESFNSFIKIVRDKPICALVTGISFLLMKIRYERNLISQSWDDLSLVPRVVNQIEKYSKCTTNFTTSPSGDGKYCITHIYGEYWTVDINECTCECGEWQVTGVPCVHAVHLIDSFRLKFEK